MLDIKSVAKSVIQGKYGTGEERKKKLEAEGFNYAEVQAEVNRQLKALSSASSSANTKANAASGTTEAVELKGIDVSYCQAGMQDVNPAGYNLKFAIIRAGYSEEVDRYLEDHVKWCEDNNIAYGFYWYSYARSVADAKKEAECCLNAIAGFNPVYPVFFDLEEDSIGSAFNSEKLNSLATTFCETIKSAGYKTGIYANPSWLLSKYNYKGLKDYDIWLAAWTGSPTRRSKYLNYFKELNITLWQFGIDSNLGYVDGNVSFFDYSKAGTTPTPKVEHTASKVHAVALDVIAGRYGVGQERKAAIEKLGYSYKEVQKEVNKILAGLA